MRSWLVVAVIAGCLAASDDAMAQPVRVAVQCENTGRTKACPAFLLGFVDAQKSLLQSPRATAEVVIYANATEVALVDRLHLRFVSSMANAPRTVEIDVDVDTRANDDSQRGQLEPAFLRGMALFVASRFPGIVTVAFAQPDEQQAVVRHLSPYDLEVDLGAWGSWTGKYQNYNGWLHGSFARVERRKRIRFGAWSNGGINRQPPLVLDDGSTVSTNTNNYNYGAQLEAAWLYNHCYSFGGSTSDWRDDPYGQYKNGWDVKLAAEWDRFRADDPRGNRLAITYVLGYQVDRYNIKNDIGERFAQYPTTQLIASGSLRKDNVAFGLSLRARGELIHPMRRHQLSASPSVDIQLGPHVDVSISFSITKREMPGPDQSEVDPMNYAQISRLSYAEPLSMNGSFSIKLHLDRTNGERNDRITDL
jgi:hypothetical protein